MSQLRENADLSRDIYEVSSREIYSNYSEGHFLRDISGIAGALENYGKLIQKFYPYESRDAGRAKGAVTHAEASLRRMYDIYCHADYNPNEIDVARILDERVTMSAYAQRAHELMKGLDLHYSDPEKEELVSNLFHNEDEAYGRVTIAMDGRAIELHVKEPIQHKFSSKYAWESTRVTDLASTINRTSALLYDTMIYMDSPLKEEASDLGKKIGTSLRMISEKTPGNITGRMKNIENNVDKIIPELKTTVRSATKQAQKKGDGIYFRYAHELFDSQVRLSNFSHDILHSDYAAEYNVQKEDLNSEKKQGAQQTKDAKGGSLGKIDVEPER